ncbi:MAG: hypothetical protein QM639_20265 [Rhodocyclaceae bacterium]
MIPPHTLDTLEQIFLRALRETSAGIDAAQITLERQTAPAPLAQASHLLALTLSGYDFRIVVLFDFAVDETTRAFFARQFRRRESLIADEALPDALSEYVNMVCGTANRWLASETRATGMSTPFILQAECKRHIERIAPEQSLVYRVKARDLIEFELVLCICPTQGATLDLAPASVQIEEAVGGELELF